MMFINTIAAWFGYGGNDDENNFGAGDIVQEFNEITDTPEFDETIFADVEGVDRIGSSGRFHNFSVARVDFDLGQYGTYSVDLTLPRYPDEESEIEEFMDCLGLSVQDLPRLEEGDFTVPFTRVRGEWQIQWDEIETQTEGGEGE